MIKRCNNQYKILLNYIIAIRNMDVDLLIDYPFKSILIIPAAFGLIGAIIAATSLHLHVSYKFGVLGEAWTKKRVQRATYVVSVIMISCLIGKKLQFYLALNMVMT